MNRRTFLASGAAVTATTGAAGCLGLLGGDGNGDVALPKPDRQFDSEAVPYPAWGQKVPDVRLPDPIAETEVRLRDVETPSFVTFFYSNCQTVCPVLVSRLRQLQGHAGDNGYADAVSFLPITFDPERDTAETLREYADRMAVDAAGENWRFLRPASKARATAVVEEEFGVAFERTEPEDMDQYMFMHTSLTLLVNADGYVERAYRSQSPDVETMTDELRTVRTS